jgi:hypothetical protein
MQPSGRLTGNGYGSAGIRAAVNAQDLHVHGGLLTGALRVKGNQAGRRSVTAASATAITAAATAAVATTPAASATAAATAAAAATVATTPATPAILTRPGFVYSQATTIELPFVKPVDRGLCLSVVVHLDEAKALASARRTILDHLRTLHGAELREQLFQGGITDPIRQIANVQLLAHH